MLKKHYFFGGRNYAETQNNDFYLFVFIIICYYINIWICCQVLFFVCDK